MNKLCLYETVLLKLAQEGNTDAKLALELGVSIPEEKTINPALVATDLRDAIAHCGEALRHNGLEWCQRTDHSLNAAISKISMALSRLV